MSYTLSIDDCLRVVSMAFRLKPHVVVSNSRMRSIARARFATCLLAHELADKSYPQIGKALKRNHSTILHAVREARKLTDPEHEKFDAEFAGRVAESRTVLETAKRRREAGVRGALR